MPEMFILKSHSNFFGNCVFMGMLFYVTRRAVLPAVFFNLSVIVSIFFVVESWADNPFSIDLIIAWAKQYFIMVSPCPEIKNY